MITRIFRNDIITKNIVKELILQNHLEDNKTTIIIEKKYNYDNINLFHNIFIDDGKEIFIKETILQHRYINNFDICVIDQSSTNKFTSISNNLKISIYLEISGWKIEISAIHDNFTDKKIKEFIKHNEEKISTARFIIDLNDWNFTISATYNERVDDIEIKRIINILNTPVETIMDFNAEINTLAKEILGLSLEKSQYSMGEITSNVKPLTKKKYSDIFPPIGFIISEKIDGLMCILSVNNKNFALLSSNNILFQGKTSKISEKTYVIGEFVQSINTFYIFDVLVDNGNNISNTENLSERIAHIDGIISRLADIPLIISKTHSEEIKSIDNLKSQFERCFSGEKKSDGIIIAEIATTFNNKKPLKWKPPEQLSIDFLAKSCPIKYLDKYECIEGKKLFILFSTIDYKTFKRFGLTFPDYYRSIFANIKSDVFPFPPPFRNNLLYSSDDIDGKIVELVYDKMTNQWKLLKIRYDRDPNIFYGNFYLIAGDLWEEIRNEFKFEYLYNGIPGDEKIYNEENNKIKKLIKHTMRRFHYSKKIPNITSIGKITEPLDVVTLLTRQDVNNKYKKIISQYNPPGILEGDQDLIIVDLVKEYNDLLGNIKLFERMLVLFNRALKHNGTLLLIFPQYNPTLSSPKIRILEEKLLFQEKISIGSFSLKIIDSKKTDDIIIYTINNVENFKFFMDYHKFRFEENLSSIIHNIRYLKIMNIGAVLFERIVVPHT